MCSHNFIITWQSMAVTLKTIVSSIQAPNLKKSIIIPVDVHPRSTKAFRYSSATLPVTKLLPTSLLEIYPPIMLSLLPPLIRTIYLDFHHPPSLCSLLFLLVGQVELHFSEGRSKESHHLYWQLFYIGPRRSNRRHLFGM